jgi:hypothetical protein
MVHRSPYPDVESRTSPPRVGRGADVLSLKQSERTPQGRKDYLNCGKDVSPFGGKGRRVISMREAPPMGDRTPNATVPEREPKWMHPTGMPRTVTHGTVAEWRLTRKASP